ncbi:unnamed protein product [Clonostachys rhizophaga]|uniref:MFS general substrate transporter n=1 Tax=Clonostachys rhizophaga TaxID=160324 RepID=A0A9N9VL30_9HYPO|nr:unnamed protein product [Clonostachys rhizophaga]
MAPAKHQQTTVIEVYPAPAQEEYELPEYAGSAPHSLGRVDGGWDAWKVLVAGFFFEAIFWGYPMCFGVFQKYYSEIPQFVADTAKIPLIGTVAQSLYYLGAPLAALATMKFPKYRSHQIWIGWLMCIFGLVSASFTTSVNGLIGTQGFLYGLGFVILSYPIISMINEWWVSRKGMAFGLISASSGLTGAVMPFIVEALLAKYGQHTTLRASAVAMAVLTFPLLFLFKSRLPPSHHTTLGRTNWAFISRPLFWVYSASILFQGIGFFFPSVFLPTYAASLNISSTKGALLLSTMSIAQVLGQFAFGYLSDQQLSVSLLAIVCCIAAAASSLTLWGLGKSLAMLILFSLLYGFFGFGFGTMRVAMGRAVSDDHSTVFATYAIYVFMQGIGNILVGPLSEALNTSPTAVERFGIGRFEGMVILTGVSSVCAAFVIGSWHAGETGLRLVKGS